MREAVPNVVQPGAVFTVPSASPNLPRPNSFAQICLLLCLDETDMYLVYLVWAFIIRIRQAFKMMRPIIPSGDQVTVHAYTHIHLIATLLFSLVLSFLALFAVLDTVCDSG